MSRSFRLEDEGFGDTTLTFGLLLASLALAVFDIRIAIGVVFHLGPIIAFCITRWAYRRHFRQRLEQLESIEAETIGPADSVDPS